MCHGKGGGAGFGRIDRRHERFSLLRGEETGGTPPARVAVAEETEGKKSRSAYPVQLFRWMGVRTKVQRADKRPPVREQVLLLRFDLDFVITLTRLKLV